MRLVGKSSQHWTMCSLNETCLCCSFARAERPIGRREGYVACLPLGNFEELAEGQFGRRVTVANAVERGPTDYF